MTINTRYQGDINPPLRRSVKRLEAFLVYNGAPNQDEDPADYYIYPKGARLT